MLFKGLKTHDIFISYVVEDREIVNTIVTALQAKELSVWYANEQLQIGKSIRATINQGLSSTRYGLVLISPQYRSYWAYGELHSLFSYQGRERLFPILFNISFEEIRSDIHGIDDIWCGVIDSSINIETQVDKIIAEICNRIEKPTALYRSFINAIGYVKKNKRLALLWGVGGVSSVLLAGSFLYYQSQIPADNYINYAIAQHIKSIDNIADTRFKEDVSSNNTEVTTLPVIMKLIENVSKHRYVFTNGIDELNSLAELKGANIIPTTGPLQPPFGLTDFRTYIFKNSQYIKIGMVNIIPVQQEIVTTRLKETGLYEVNIKYKNPIRYISMGIYTDSVNNTTTQIVNFWGLKPNETLVFEKNEENWQLIRIY